jgi:hypothetical protein
VEAQQITAAIRTWLRYVVPLTVLSVIALSPVVVVALRARPPADAAGANALVALGYELLALAWFGQLLLIGAASAVAGSQLAALRAGFAQLLRALVPCLAAVVAIALAGLALALPGVALVVLLSLTGASPKRGLAALRDSIAAARRRLPGIALAVAAMLVLDVAIAWVSQRLLVPPLPKRPTSEQLAAARQFLHCVAAVLVVLSPLPALVVASFRAPAET